MATAKANSVEEAMKTADSPATPEAPGTWGREGDIADRIAEGVSRGIAAGQPPRKMTFGEYQRKHPISGGAKLTRPVFQNGFQVPPDRLSKREVELMNQVHRSGRYLDRYLEVIVREDGSQQVLEFRWPTRTIDQRMAEREHFGRGWEKTLELVIEEQTALDAADEAKQRRVG